MKEVPDLSFPEDQVAWRWRWRSSSCFLQLPKVTGASTARTLEDGLRRRYDLPPSCVIIEERISVTGRCKQELLAAARTSMAGAACQVDTAHCEAASWLYWSAPSLNIWVAYEAGQSSVRSPWMNKVLTSSCCSASPRSRNEPAACNHSVTSDLWPGRSEQSDRRTHALTLDDATMINNPASRQNVIPGRKRQDVREEEEGHEWWQQL